MKRYDYIIAGGGLSGLSLAFYLNKNAAFSDKKILIIDKIEKKENDRTWCFWSDEVIAFEEIVTRAWKEMYFFGSDDFKKFIDLTPFKYKMIRSADFYNFIKNSLSKNKNIDWLTGQINALTDLENGAAVTVEGVDYQADWLFNSTFNLADFQKKTDRYFYQLQHFKGWIIKTPKVAFHPEKIHLMDFRTEQYNNARFFYVLPFDAHKALIEYTIFSDTLLTQEAYDAALKKYIQEQLGIEDYEIEETEYGVIPMTNHPFPKAKGKHILNIGTIGGDVKASTGYAFSNIQKVVQKVVQNLEKEKHPFYKITLFEKRFNIYDTLILHILQTEGHLIKPIFTQLFKKNKIQIIFNFLNEKTNFLQELIIFLSFSPRPFYKGIFHVYCYQAIKRLFFFNKF